MRVAGLMTQLLRRFRGDRSGTSSLERTPKAEPFPIEAFGEEEPPLTALQAGLTLSAGRIGPPVTVRPFFLKASEDPFEPDALHAPCMSQRACLLPCCPRPSRRPSSWQSPGGQTCRPCTGQRRAGRSGATHGPRLSPRHSSAHEFPVIGTSVISTFDDHSLFINILCRNEA